MSWDLLVQDLPPGISSLAEIPDDFKPAPLDLDRDNVVSAIRAEIGEVVITDVHWCSVTAPTWSIEFNLGDSNPIDHFAMHVYGDGDGVPFERIGRLLARLSVRALDPQSETGIFVVTGSVPGHAAWAAVRDGLAVDEP